ncbi:MAG: hypothetical protein QOD26_73 [Betaproteobacteria bacterium]|jgi:hypothetical protein|nr:hypothetical protein [Betaproteobacteria bacterium]
MILTIARGLAGVLLVVAAEDALSQAAQKPAPQTIERATTPLSGGTIDTAFTVSGQAGADMKIEYTDAKGAKQFLSVKRGERIEGLSAQSAKISSATANGGKLELTVSALDAQGMATVGPLTGTTLKNATLTEVKPTKSSQKVKIGSTAIEGTVTSDLARLENAEASGVTVKDAQVSTALKKDEGLGVTTQAVTDWVGDYVIFNVDAARFIALGSSGPEVVAPQGTCFRVYQEVEKPDPADSTKKITYLRGTFVTGWFPRWPSPMPPWKCPSQIGDANEKLPYEVQKKWLTEDLDRSRFGYTYGVLVAPFKYYKASRQFSAGASVGPYLGHRVHDRPGSSTVAAVSIGAASAVVKNADGSSSTKTGMSIALAALSQFKDFNVGLIAGRDFFSKSDDIPISGRVWLSVSVGKKLD